MGILFPTKGNSTVSLCTAGREDSQPANKWTYTVWSTAGRAQQAKACSPRVYLDIQEVPRACGAGKSHGLGRLFRDHTACWWIHLASVGTMWFSGPTSNKELSLPGKLGIITKGLTVQVVSLCSCRCQSHCKVRKYLVRCPERDSL